MNTKASKKTLTKNGRKIPVSKKAPVSKKVASPASKSGSSKPSTSRLDSSKKNAAKTDVAKKSISQKSVGQNNIMKKSVTKKLAAKKIVAKKITEKMPVTKKGTPKKSVVKKISMKKSAVKKIVVKDTGQQKAGSQGSIDLVYNKNNTYVSGKTAKDTKKAVSAKKQKSGISQNNRSSSSVSQEDALSPTPKNARQSSTKKQETSNVMPSSSAKPSPSPSSLLSAVVSSKVILEKQDFKQVKAGAPDEFPQEVVDPGFLTNDEVFDEADHAQWQQLREQAAIHARAINLNKPETHPDFDGEHCIECGENIPNARLKLLKVRCVDCQNDLENQNRLASRHQGGNRSSGSMFDLE